MYAANDDDGDDDAGDDGDADDHDSHDLEASRGLVMLESLLKKEKVLNLSRLLSLISSRRHSKSTMTFSLQNSTLLEHG